MFMDKQLKSLLYLLIPLTLLLSFSILLSGNLQISNPHSALLHQDNPIMPFEDLERGMIGTGYSIFNDLTMSSFEAHIEGLIQGDSNNAGNIIIARLYGHPVDNVGVIAGMSGSPVYVDGKLIGAIAAAFQWELYPVAYIRPIEEMLTIIDFHDNYRDHSIPPLEFIPLENTSLGLYYEEHPEQRPENRGELYQQAKTPLFFSGFDQEVVDAFSMGFNDLGFIPLAGGGRASAEVREMVDNELYPGDAVGVAFMLGDMAATAVGTVSYRQGNKVLIFGHQTLFRGFLDLPMTKEFIQTTIPLQTLSFKIGSTIDVVGHTLYDSNKGVLGELGVYANTVPLSIQLVNEDSQRELNMELAQDAMLLPNMLTAAVINSAKLFFPDNAYAAIDFTFEIKVKRLDTGVEDTIIINDFWTGMETTSIMAQGVLNLVNPVTTLLINKFAAVEIQSIKVQLEIKPQWIAAEIEQFTIMKNNIAAGDIVPILITFRIFNGERIQQRFEIKIPDLLRGSPIVLGLGSAKQHYAYDTQLAPARYSIKTYDQLIEYFNTLKDYSVLTIWIDIPDWGLMRNGYHMNNLPPSVASLLSTSNQTGYAGVPDRIEYNFQTDYLISGVFSIPINIEVSDLRN